MLAASLLAASCSGDAGNAGSASPTSESPSQHDEDVECAGIDECDAEISSSIGLSDGDVVQIRAAGWDPNIGVGLAQCADPDDPDSPAFDLTPAGLPPGEMCNVLGVEAPAETHQSNDAGVVEFDYTVQAGERMKQNSEGEVTCDATHDCVVNLFIPGANRFRSDAPRVTFHLTFN